MNIRVEQKLVDFFAEWHIPQELLNSLAPLQEDNQILDLFYPGNVVPFNDKMRWWKPLLKYALLPIGNCPNSDFIAIDWRKHLGAVVYISHDEFDTTGKTEHDISAISVQVASSLQEFLEGLQKGIMPLDYYEAKKRHSH